jgi:Uma2 family endonuclease
MSAITTMPPATARDWVPSPPYRLTLDQYERMVDEGILGARDRVHLIHGILVAKMVHKPPHAVVDELLGAELARVAPRGWHVRAAKPLRIPASDSEPEPDRCVVRGRIADYADRHPGPADVALVAEVADSSAAKDRGHAANLYGPAGIPVYWIVDVNARRVEVYSLAGPRGYGPPEFFTEGQSIPVVIGGRVRGRIAVKDILPPKPRRPKAGG